jgi:hypothetical protein
MRQHARITGFCLAVIGVGMASATTVVAAPRTAVGATTAKPAGYSIASVTLPMPNGVQTSGSVVCPVKKGVQTLPLSGGALLQTDSVNANINSSYPTTEGWAVDVNNASGSASNFTVYVVCAKKPSGYVVKSSSAGSNPADTQSISGLGCPSGHVVTGGGALSTSGSTLVNLNSSFPESTRIWGVTMNNASSSSAGMTVFLVCAKFNVKKTSYQYVAGSTTTNPPGEEAATQATCPPGLSVLGGGVSSHGGGLGVGINSTFPFTGGWMGNESNSSTGTPTLTTYLLCAS